MNCNVFIQTKEGAEFANRIAHNYNVAVTNGHKDTFRSYCLSEAESVQKDISHLLGDHEMERKYSMTDKDDGWMQYKELCDRYYVLRFYQNA